MSHVATVELDVKDLEALAAACRRVGLEFVWDQRTYRWFGESVGDAPLPAGFTADELGHCEHAIRVATPQGLRPNPVTYEIGVVRRRDGRPGWTLLLDEWMGGYGLIGKCGEGAGLLKQAYALECATREAARQGYRVQERKQQDGSVQLVCTR